MRQYVPVMLSIVTLLLAGAGCEPTGPSQPTEGAGGAAADTEADDATGAAGDASDTSLPDTSEDDAESLCAAPGCVDDRFRVETERGCQVDGEARPERCDADPTSYDGWGLASAVSRVEFQSERARECCFNLDGSEDGSVDNAFGELAADLPIDVDRQIQANLAAGTFVALGEYQGLQDLDAQEQLEGINIYLGVFGSGSAGRYIRKADQDCQFTETACELQTTPGERFLVDPTILEQGIHPEVHFPDPSLEGSTLEAGPSELVARFSIPGLGRHALRVRGATFEATVDRQASSVGEGLVIEEGRIGGYILIRDLLDLLNGIVGHCNCLGRPDRALTYPTQDSDDPDYTTRACQQGTAPDEECRVQCKPELVDLDRCSQIDNMACGRFPEFCLIVDSLTGRADLDTDGDGQLDALSFGAIYEMTGARIDGVANFLRANDRRVETEGELSVDRVFSNRAGWLAAFAPSGGELDLIGHTRIGPGNHVDRGIELPPDVDARSVLLVAYADDGPEPGTFEPDQDSQLRTHPGGGRVSTQVRLLEGS